MAPSSSTWVSRSSSSCRDSCCTAPSSQRAWRTPDGHGSGPTWSVAQCGCCPATGWRSPSSLWSSRSSSMSSGRIGGSSTRWARHGCPAGCSTASRPRGAFRSRCPSTWRCPSTPCSCGRRFGHLTAARQARSEFGRSRWSRWATLLARRFVFDRGDGARGFLVWSRSSATWTGSLRASPSRWPACAGRVGPTAPRAALRRRASRTVLAPRGVRVRGAGLPPRQPGDSVPSRASLWRCCSWRLRSSATSAPGLPHRVLGNRVMRSLGVVSYGIFLWNEPIASWVSALPVGAGPWGPFVVFLVTALAAIGLGTLSYWLIERPSMALVTHRRAVRRRSMLCPPRRDITTDSRPDRRSLRRSGSVPRKAEPGGPRVRRRIDNVPGRDILRRPISIGDQTASFGGRGRRICFCRDRDDGLWSMTKAAAVWTATTALTTQSQTRAPEQDAVLSLGYVDYFNQPTYQQVLRAEATIPAAVTLKAETGAASPIVYIEAMSSLLAVSKSAAQAAADVFRPTSAMVSSLSGRGRSTASRRRSTRQPPRCRTCRRLMWSATPSSTRFVRRRS